MVNTLTHKQLKSLETTERVASCFSVVGTMFIFVTFLTSSNFRKPINRLVFYASWGNMLCNVATLMSESPIRAGAESHLCQFQAFLIQMFVPADALWNLAMAINVYLTLFKKYNATQLKALEWKYHLMCYGTPFLVAFIYIFIETESRGKIYGSAVLWCWIAGKWDFLRIATCYAPAWICIIASFTIYAMAGREIFAKRHQLRSFAVTPSSPATFTTHNIDPSRYRVTNEYSVTSEYAPKPFTTLGAACAAPDGHASSSSDTSSNSKGYSVNITSVRPPMPHHQSSQQNKIKAAKEANRAAFGYAKVASLFFVSLLVTWVPSSINRVYALIYPGAIPIQYAYAAGIVLSLMGFWNAVIYIATSHRACRALLARIFKGDDGGFNSRDVAELGCRRSRVRSDGDSLEGLAVQAESV
ncbi:hypothetical protein ACLMJK_008888 [Lecanora helva]